MFQRWAKYFSLNLLPDNVYRKIVTLFFLYLLIFKLNLKIYGCLSILGPPTNQKSFNALSYDLWNVMFCNNCQFKKTGQIQCQGEL